MKKLIIILILFSISSYTITMAQNNSILDVSVKFCNQNHITKSLEIESISGQREEICMQFINSSNKDILVWYEFVDWVKTEDSYNARACNNTAIDSKFNSFFQSWSKEIKIWANSIFTQRDYIIVPYELTGTLNWCLTYFALSDQDKTKNPEMINVLVRKASFIDIFPKWSLETHAITVKDQIVTPRMNFFISSRFFIYAVITLIIIIWTIISLVKQRRFWK